MAAVQCHSVSALRKEAVKPCPGEQCERRRRTQRRPPCLHSSPHILRHALCPVSSDCSKDLQCNQAIAKNVLFTLGHGRNIEQLWVKTNSFAQIFIVGSVSGFSLGMWSWLFCRRGWISHLTVSVRAFFTISARSPVTFQKLISRRGSGAPAGQEKWQVSLSWSCKSSLQCQVWRSLNSIFLRPPQFH